jgi:hypothetical protein
MVGVVVKVGDGTVGVKVGTSVNVNVIDAGIDVSVRCTPRNLSTLMEQAESTNIIIKRG